MNRSHWLRYSLGLAALLLVSVTLRHGYQPSQSIAPEPSPAPVAPVVAVVVPPVSVVGPHTAAGAVPLPAVGRAQTAPAPAPLAEFNAWAEKFAVVPASAALAEGETLAKARYQEMLQLIRSDPERALASALPYRLRKTMPAGFAPYLEQPVSGRGDFKVIQCWAAPGQAESELPPTEYRVTLKKSTYQAFTYGARAHQMSRKHIALHGVALTDENGHKIMALGGDSLRVVEVAEASDLAAAGRLPTSATCPVCGAAVADATQATLAEMGAEYLCFDSADHLATYNNQLNQALTKFWPAAASSSEAAVAAQAAAVDDANVLFPQLAPQGHSGGRKGSMKLLYMPVTFADDPIPAQSQDGAQATCAYVAKVYKENSYGSVNWETDVTPLLRLPQRKTAYADGIAGGTPVSVLGDALAIARSLGYDGPYDDQYVVFNSLNPVVTFGGRSDGLINGSPGAMPHELGHSSFGWTHANYLDLSGTSGMPNDGRPVDPDSVLGHDDVNAPLPMPVGKPQMVVYGDPYDIMGGGGSHFGVMFKNQVNWLTDERVRFINSNQTNRIYAFDVPQIFQDRLYALRMHKDFDKQYWVSYRQAFPDNPWLSHGVEIQWQSASAGNNTLLLDTSYTSYNRKNDCTVTIGRTFADPPAHIYVTPVAQGGDSGTNKWIDVVVNIGPFPGNNTPSVSLSANALRVNLNEVVTLTAAAQDPDGDTLAYNWDFSDNSLGPNAPVATKSWAAAGQYVVRCEVSDMKGGVASAYVVVVVGNPTTFTISGRVLDQDGNPLQGVRVHNGAALPANPPIPQEGSDANTTPVTPTTHRATFTDSQGYYTIGNIPAGNYDCRAFIYGYHTVAQFADPVDITAASANGLDFVATALPRVSVEKVVDAPENGIPGDGTTNSGVFRITREGGDLSQPLLVRYRLDGTAVMVTDYLLWPENLWTNVTTLPNGNKVTNVARAAYGRTVIPEWQSSVDMAVSAFDNAVGNGNQSVIMTLVLQTNDYRAVPYLTNVIYTNYISSNSTYYLITNTELHTNIYTVNIPGWELLPYGPSDTPTWFQTDPSYAIANAEATVWIEDDDPPNLPTVAVQAAGDVASETYNDRGMFMFTRNNAPKTNALTIHFTVSGSASNGVDYVALPNQVTIPPNESFVLLPVEAINDLFVEGDEYVSVTVSPDPAYNGAGASATVTIQDDDLPDVIIYASDSVAGKVGGNNGRVTVSRSGDLAQPLVVNYLVSGSAVSGRDYQPLAQQITIPAGSITADIVIIPIDNALAGARTVVIQLADSQAYTIDFQNFATVTIQDSVPTVTLTAGGNAAEGGGNTTFTVTRDGATTNSLTVYFSVGGSAVEISDYSSIGTNITIPVGSATATITIAPINDLFREHGDAFGDETVILQLQPGPNYNVGNPNSGTVRITDNDGSGLPQIGFMIKESTVREDAGMVYLLVKCSANPATDQGINFEFHQSSGNAVENINYGLGLWCGTNTPLVGMVPGGFVTNLVPIPYAGRFNHFTPPTPAGEFTHPEDTIGYIPLTILNDNLAAGNRTLTVRLFPPTGYVTNFDVNTNVVTVTNGGATALVTNTTTNVYVTHLKTNAYIGDYLTHTITILDVGVTTVGVSADVPFAYEAGLQPGLFVISRVGPVDKALTVTYAVTGDAAPGDDYVRMTTNGRLASITIPAGTNRVLLPVVPLNNPTEELPRSVVLTVMDGTNYQTGAASGTVTIISDDGTIQFTARQYEFPENVGWAHVPVVRSGDTSRAAAVDYQFIPGTAQAPNDYLGVAGTLNFAAGETEREILVQIVDNNVVEPDKIFTIQLQNPTGGVPLGGQNVATIVILNDDTSIQFATNTFTVNENAGQAQITVTRIGLLTNAASAVFTTFDGTATDGLDYTGVSVQVNFAPGETNQTIAVPILDDVLFEGDETVGLMLSDTSPGIYLGPLPASTLVILDDECTLTFTTNNFVVWEYAPYAEVTIQRLGGTVNPVSVDFHTTDGTATAVSNLDYYAVTTNLFFRGNEWLVSTNGTGQLEYHPGETSKTVLVPLHDDIIGEGNESFNIILDNLQTFATALEGTTLLGPVSNAIVTILDNEMPGNVDYEYQQPTVSNPNPGPNGPVYSLAVQTDGMTVLGGAFTQVDGKVYNRIARMQSVGVADTAFNPGYGANGTVYAVAMTPDNRIVVGGAFTRMDTSNHAGITRLRANGDVDPAFNPGAGVVNGTVRALAVQGDGRIIMGGDFTTVGATARGRLARLNTNGLVDVGFAPAADAPVYAVALQPDGRVLVGGAFTNIAGTVRRSIARLMSNGVVDASFTGVANLAGPVNAIAVQADGGIVVGGAFTNAVGITNGAYLVRLNQDGTIDASFNTGSGLKEGFRSLASDSKDPAAAAAPVVYMPPMPRIVGGHPTTVNQFPYQVAIINNPYTAQNIWNDQFCGGSILSSRWILTAAHCMYGQQASGVAVAVGVTDLTHPQPGRVFLVDRIIVHPAYNAATTQNDVALIHLTEAIDFAGSYVAAPVPIVTPADAAAGLTSTGTIATITGWGNTSGSSVVYPTNLYVASVPITATSAYTAGSITPDMIMAGYVQGGVDTCQGDSGGPLVVTNGVGVIKQAGITSWGNGCARAGYPGVYTRVSYFYNWITTNTASAPVDPGNPVQYAAVNAVAIDAHGRIIIGGNFTNYNGTPRNYFARVARSGGLDFMFNIGSGANDMVRAVAVQPDTAVFIGGDFTVVNEIPRNRFARIHGNEYWDVPGVEFNATVYYVLETNGPAVITVERTGNTNVAFQVDFATSDGTAVNVLDYDGVTNTLSFGVGEMSKTILITVHPHPEITGDKTVHLALVNAPYNVDLSGNSTATLVIVDAEKSVRFSRDTYIVRSSDTNAVIEVLREGNLTGTLSVTMRTLSGGTAVPGLDYGVVSNVLTFAEGQTNQYVLVPVYLRPPQGVVKTVSLVLTNPVGCELGYPSNAWLYIQDADLGLGSVDPSFNPGTAASGSGGLVRTLALAPDAKVLVGGAFTSFNGMSRNSITRLHPNGTQDLGFDPGKGPNGLVASVAVAADSHIILGGGFTNVNNFVQNHVGRLSSDGSVETSFNQPNMINGSVSAVALQADGQIVVAGSFSQPAPYLVRLRGDGGVDTSFDSGTGPNGLVNTLLLTTNGADLQILMAGGFTSVNGAVRSRLARLNALGSLDDSFAPVVSNGVVTALAVDSSRRVLIGGTFTNVGGLSRRGIARLNSDGSVDPSFDPGTGIAGAAGATVFGIGIQPDGKVVIVGNFITVNQTNRGRVARLLDNGALDLAFGKGVGADATVYAVLCLPDNGILIGGDFSTVDGLARAGVARLVGGMPPELKPVPVGFVAGQWTITIQTEPGARYVLEGSANLLDWTTIDTITAVGYSAVLADPAASGFSYRFYRVGRLMP